MKVIIDIYLALDDINKCVKVFSQDITKDVNKSMNFDQPAYSVTAFEGLCNKIAEDFHTEWEIANDLGGRTYAKVKIMMEY